MSKYYKINGLKVRVSDHEPNFSMDRIRGRNDVEFYTVSADNRTLSVADQVDFFCQKNDMDIKIFSDILKDFPDEEYIPIKLQPKIEVTSEFIKGYRAISGKGSMKKKARYCNQQGIDAWKVSQGNYTLKQANV